MYNTQSAAVHRHYQSDDDNDIREVCASLMCEQCGHTGLIYLGPKISQGQRGGYVHECDRAKCPACRAINEF